MTRKFLIHPLPTDTVVLFADDNERNEWLAGWGISDRQRWFYEGIYSHDKIECQIVGRIVCSAVPYSGSNRKTLTPNRYKQIVIIEIPQGRIPIHMEYFLMMTTGRRFKTRHSLPLNK